MSTIRERVEKYCKYKSQQGEKITVALFEKLAGLSNGYFKPIRKNIGEDKRDQIAKAFPDLNLAWLEREIGEMLLPNKSSTNKPKTKTPPPFDFIYTVKDFFSDYYSYLNHKEIKPMLLEKQLSELTEDESAEIAKKMGLDYNDFVAGVEIVTKSSRSGKLVPVYSAVTGAGNGVANARGTREGWVNVGDLLKDSEGSLYVYGNSMIPGYPPGSLVGIRPLNETFIEPGSVYVVETESNRYIKRLYYNGDKTSLVCVSDNHIKHMDGPMEGEYFYPPFEIPLSSVRMIYKVVGVIKRNSVVFT